MFRLVVYALLAIILISFIRSIAGIIAKAFSGAIETSPGSSAARPSVPAGGELKRDPVCGTYVSETTAIRKSAAGQTYYFCSTACRDKFRA